MKEFKLDDHPKITPGFKIPDGYFENFPDQVMQKVAKPETKVIPIFAKRKWIFAAAAVLVLALAVPAINKFTSANQPDQATLENYIAYQSDISDEEIVDLLDKEDIDKIKIDYKLEDKAIEEALSSGSDLENILD